MIYLFLALAIVFNYTWVLKKERIVRKFSKKAYLENFQNQIESLKSNLSEIPKEYRRKALIINYALSVIVFDVQYVLFFYFIKNVFVIIPILALAVIDLHEMISIDNILIEAKLTDEEVEKRNNILYAGNIFRILVITAMIIKVAMIAFM